MSKQLVTCNSPHVLPEMYCRVDLPCVLRFACIAGKAAFDIQLQVEFRPAVNVS